MIDEPMRVVLEMIDAVMKKTDAMSGATDTLPPLMSNLKIEEKTDDPPGRRQEEDEGEQDSSEYPDYFLGLSRDIFERSVKRNCDTDEERHRAMKSIARFCALVESRAPRTIEEFEASIPDDPDDWTQEMWEYMYQKEQEKVRNFEEQQLALEKKKRIQKRDWMKHIEEDGKLRRRQVKERERELKWLGLNMSTVFHVLN
ncbi:unnamed protein product [Prunus armeniaca]|uniref:Uncharacterized protein n=1 Tax=Prunus armeniaca TaxID=36596 RepID=A0A6J5VSY6_PRUAR|nr:unnamed protein product [Prunus armeniaca]